MFILKCFSDEAEYIRLSVDSYCPVNLISLKLKYKNAFLFYRSSLRLKNDSSSFLMKLIYVLLVTSAGIFCMNDTVFYLNKSIITFNYLNEELVLLREYITLFTYFIRVKSIIYCN